MARTAKETFPNEREKVAQILELLTGLTMESAETVLNAVQHDLDRIKNRTIVNEHSTSSASGLHAIHQGAL